MREKGYSLNEISSHLSVSKSTVSVWVRNLKLSAQTQFILDEKKIAGRKKAIESIQGKTRQQLSLAKSDANILLKNINCSKDTQKVICSMLYWCEGEKTNNDGTFTFANSDPDLVRLFLRLLRNSFEVNNSKFRALIHLHSYHDIDKQLRFWSKITNIPKSQFLRVYQKSNSGKQYREGYQGCLSLRHNDVKVAREIQAIARASMEKLGL